MEGRERQGGRPRRTTARGDPVGRDDQGASSLLAIVLMMGFVAAASVSLFVVGGTTLTDTESAMEDRHAEKAFHQFDQDVASVAFSRDGYRTMAFDVQSEDATVRTVDSGRVEIYVDGSQIVDEGLGGVVYENDGTVIAYQGGGVWRGTGRDARMVSSPDADYNKQTVTFPIPKITGGESLRSGEFGIEKIDSQPAGNDNGYVGGRTVTVKVTSEYYMGWAEYFRTEMDPRAVTVSHAPVGPTGTVTVKFGPTIANASFDETILATGDVVLENGNPTVDGTVAATDDVEVDDGMIVGPAEEDVDRNFTELDAAIQWKANVAQSNPDITDVEVDSGTVELEDGGTYFDDDGFELENGEDLQVDVTDGNVTLIVDGDVTLDKGDVEVHAGSTDNAFRIYTTGDFSMRNSFAGDVTDRSDTLASSAKHLQVYGTSAMLVGISGGNTRFVGTIHAPRDDPALDDDDANTAMLSGPGDGTCEGFDVCIVKGNTAMKGAIVGGPTKIAQSAGIASDSSLSDVELTLQGGDAALPPITYLQVSVHTVEVNDSYTQDVAPADFAAASVRQPTSENGHSDGDATVSVSRPAVYR